MEDNNQNTELKQNERGQAAPRAAIIIMGIIMVAIYMGMAFLLVFTTLFVGKVPEWVRYMMGVVFFVYGIFRAYRIFKTHK